MFALDCNDGMDCGKDWIYGNVETFHQKDFKNLVCYKVTLKLRSDFFFKYKICVLGICQGKFKCFVILVANVEATSTLKICKHLGSVG